MISILIPVYNFDPRPLVKSLHVQCKQAGIAFEIICLDDASQEEFKKNNREMSGWENVVYNELEKNAGRSKIRNLLAQQAKYEYLLFMDCDSECENERYIINYMSHLQEDKVIYGGRSYSPAEPSDKKLYLRWYYGVERESVAANVRQIHPYRSFMTNNFIIPKKVFEKVKFDETLTGYGHEDTLFSFCLREKEIKILHIENPLRHIGLESAEVFLENTRNGLKNLLILINMKKINSDNRLYSAYRWIKLPGLKKFVVNRFRKKEKKYLENLLSEKPSLKIFDWYKLGYLLAEER